MTANKLGDLSLIIVVLLLFCFLTRSFMLLADSLPILSRSIDETKGVSLLWSKETSIEPLHTSWVQFFTPTEQRVVFISSDSLQALNMTTGQSLWETQVPDPITVRLYNDTLFIASYEWLEEAPFHANSPSYGCSFIESEASLSAYNPHTGEKIWGYGYHGVDSIGLYFQDRSVYLTGSANHGSDRSLAQIDTDTGLLLYLGCTRWPTEPIQSPSTNEGDMALSDNVVSSERDLKYKNKQPLFFGQGTRLNILDGDSKEVLGYVEFNGAELNPLEIDVAIQNDLVVVYLADSGQLFGFRLAVPVKIK
jgi:hypothetical protein